MASAQEILGAADLAKSHWGKRIVAAERRGAFTRRDRFHAYDWPTCACGKLDPRIPRAADGSPMDSELADLGGYFYSAVVDDDFAEAAEFLVAIEHYAAKLLQEAPHG